MPIIKETTIHDMKTNFSRYAADLLDGTYDEIIVKNRTVPTLRVLPYVTHNDHGLDFGFSTRQGHLVVSDDWDMNDGDEEISGLFDEALR